jgi:hypothetical protein
VPLNNVSRSTAVGAVLHPGAPAHRGGGGEGTEWAGFALALGADEILLKGLNELEGAKTCSTSGKRTNAERRAKKRRAGEVLGLFVGVVWR